MLKQAAYADTIANCYHVRQAPCVTCLLVEVWEWVCKGFFFSDCSGQITRGGPLLRSSNDLFLRVKKHGVALPETIEITSFSFGGVEAGRRDGGTSGARQCWIDPVGGLSEERVLRCDQTRSVEYRLEIRVGTRNWLPTQH